MIEYMFLNINQSAGGHQHTKIFVNGISSSGKSFVCHILSKHGYHHIDADTFSHVKHMFQNIDPNQYFGDKLLQKKAEQLLGKEMFIESHKYPLVVFDDIIQYPIKEFIPRDQLFIIIVYANLETLTRNIERRRKTGNFRSLNVFNQYVKMYEVTSNPSIDIINRISFISILQKYLKYFFIDKQELIAFAHKIFSDLGINDDIDHYVKIRQFYNNNPNHPIEWDYIVDINNKSSSDIEQELTSLLSI